MPWACLPNQFDEPMNGRKRRRRRRQRQRRSGVRNSYNRPPISILAHLHEIRCYAHHLHFGHETECRVSQSHQFFSFSLGDSSYVSEQRSRHVHHFLIAKRIFDEIGNLLSWRHTQAQQRRSIKLAIISKCPHSILLFSLCLSSRPRRL